MANRDPDHDNDTDPKGEKDSDKSTRRPPAGKGTGGPGNGPPTGQNANSQGPYDQTHDVIQFLKEALAQAGDPSSWGGTSPAGFDCSGLVVWAAEHFESNSNVHPPRTSEDQAAWAIPTTNLQPGDLLFEYGSDNQGHTHIKDGHVAIYLGNGLVLAADETSTVRIRAYQPGEAISAGRIPGFTWDPGASGAQAYLKDLTKIGIKVQQSGPITVPLPGIKLPSVGAAPKHNTAVYIDKFGNEAIKSPTPSSVYSAYERVQTALRMWGLDDKQLVQMAYQRAIAGEDYNQIIADIRKTPQYAAQFPGMAFRAKAGLPLISESQYVSYERSMMGLATKYSLPKGSIDKHEVGELIAHNVSPVEFSQRLQGLSTLVTQANPLVKHEFEKYFGVKGANGALMAYWDNPNKATMLLTEQLHAAEFGAQTQESGLGALNRGQAMQLAHFEYLHTPGTVASAIDKASEFSDLRGSAPGSAVHPLSAETILASEIPGLGQTLAQAGATVRRNAMARAGAVQRGGGFAANQKGLSVGGATTEGVGGTAE